MRLDGAAVLLTGASSGIGAATAGLLARKGARPLLVGRDEPALRRMGATSHAADLTEPGAPSQIAEWAVTTAGAVDVLIANAGQGWAGPLQAMPPDRIAELVAVNLTASMCLTRLLLPDMLRRGRGHVVFVSSIAGHMGVAEEAVYAATKAGLHGFAGSLRQEVAGTGVGVSVLVPGVVDTAFFSRRGAPYVRARPRPVPAVRAARALLRAVERDREEVFVPAWLRLPARLHGVAPAFIGELQRRFG
ncbi:MAG: SDR family NAD(P)-dependent oxidoreductase [Sciscionella sp.]